MSMSTPGRRAYLCVGQRDVHDAAGLVRVQLHGRDLDALRRRGRGVHRLREGGAKGDEKRKNEGNGGSTRTLMRIFTASFRFLSVSFSSWQGKGRRGRDGNDDDDAAVRARAKHYLVVGF